MLPRFIKNIDKRFYIILTIGIILRIHSFIFVELAPDSYSYLEAAEGILNGDYNSPRPPSFPLYVSFFIIIVRDSILAIKLASFISAILVIVASYFVFSKLALKFFGDNERGKKKSNLVGLLISLYYSIHNYLIYNNGRALREDFIALLYILLFYYVLLEKKEENWKNNLIITFLIIILTLSHVSTGISTYLAVILFLIISKSLKVKSKISKLKIFLITVSFICSYSFWLIFCLYKFGDPFYTMTLKIEWYSRNSELDLTSFKGIFDALFSGFFYGIPKEFSLLFNSIGTIFILLALFTLIYYYNERQFLFLLILMIINFLYLCIFIYFAPNIRLLLYFFPIILYLSFIIIVEIWDKNKDKLILKISIFNKKVLITINKIFILFLATFFIKQIDIFFNYKMAKFLGLISEICLIIIILSSFFDNRTLLANHGDKNINKILFFNKLEISL